MYYFISWHSVFCNEADHEWSFVNSPQVDNETVRKLYWASVAPMPRLNGVLRAMLEDGKLPADAFSGAAAASSS